MDKFILEISRRVVITRVGGAMFTKLFLTYIYFFYIRRDEEVESAGDDVDDIIFEDFARLRLRGNDGDA